MKITRKLLQAKSEKQGVDISKLQYLDLTQHGIVTIENLEEAASIQTLLLQSNNISIIENLARCHQLWHINISCNDVSNLYTLARFIALGYINLSYNNLSWHELMKIRHIHILELNLHGNPKLDKDPNYRVHVIDCMPCTWMLDGRQITAAERIQVEDFFQRSALTAHPVRKKLTREQFIPSSLKKLQTEGTYGIRTVHLMMRFPKSGALNVATDRRRLRYLAYNLCEDLKVYYQCRHSKFNDLPLPDFESLLASRRENTNQCNVLLLLLVTFLEFSLPFDLLQETITCAKLDKMSETDVRLLFALPKTYVLRLAAILLSSVKIDRDDKKVKKALPKRPKSVQVHTSSVMAAGQPSPRHDLIVSRAGTGVSTVSPIKPVWTPEREPRLGDKVLLGPQCLSFILALPEHDVALIQMESIQAPHRAFVSCKSSGEHYAYIDLSQYSWELQHSYWKPMGTTGDKITLHDDSELAAVGFNPPAIDADRLESDDEYQDDTALHPSPRDSDEELQMPISALMKDKLNLSQPTSGPPITLPVSPDIDIELPVTDHEHTSSKGALHDHKMSTSKRMLYDCLKCAMNLVQENNKHVVHYTNQAAQCSSSRSPDPVLKADWTDRQHRIDVDLNPISWRESDQIALTEKQVIPERPKSTFECPKLAPERPKSVPKSSNSATQSQKSACQRPKSAYQRPKSSRKFGMAPRPSTATSVCHRAEAGSPIMIQMGNHWLAGGRDVNYQERRANFEKIHQYTPGWLEGAPKRPKSVGPRRRQQTPRLPVRAKSAGAHREPSLWVGQSNPSNQPPPSPATSNISLHRSPPPPPTTGPDYMVQSRRQNYPSYAPIYGAPKRPPSPLLMVVK